MCYECTRYEKEKETKQFQFRWIKFEINTFVVFVCVYCFSSKNSAQRKIAQVMFLHGVNALRAWLQKGIQI